MIPHIPQNLVPTYQLYTLYYTLFYINILRNNEHTNLRWALPSLLYNQLPITFVIKSLLYDSYVGLTE